MVAIVTGAGLGVENSSGWVLGSRGQLGVAAFGRYGENVYVNAATGNLAINRTDEILIGEGPDDVIGRNYNSLGDKSDDNGDNWRLSAQRLVTNLTGTVNTAGSTITRIDWDASKTIYTWDTTRSAYVSKSGSGAFNTLTYASNVWTWTDGSTQATETYDNLNGGRITASKDADGNTLSFTYTGTLLTRVTTQDGEHTDLTWSGNNLINIVTTKSDSTTLTRVSYTYDGSNRLQTVTTDLSPDDNSTADGNTVVTTYGYDANGRVSSITQTGGAKLDIAYDASGRVHTLTQTISTGITSTTTIDYFSGYTNITDANGNVTTLKYDSNSQLTEMDLPPAQSGAAAQVVKYTYDSDGNVLTATDASGNTTTYTYDTNGNLIQSVDELGNGVTYKYDSNNQLLNQTQYLVPGTAGGNMPPVANNENLLVTSVGDSITFDPRLNDGDPDNDPLTIIAVSTPLHGTAVINSGTSITYTRTGAGADSFTYTISDGHGHTATATISIADYSGISNQAPTAANDTVEIDGVGTALTFDPRTNDTDPNGDALTITAVSTAAHGTATIVNNGTAIHYVRSTSSTDSFTYTISDGHGHTSTATITVNDSTGGSNSAPTATNDTVEIDGVGNSLTFDPRATDSDPDNDALTITAISTPSLGTASILNNGTAIQYTRTGSGTDSFTYTISDGHGHTVTATITVNDSSGGTNSAPTANADHIYTPSGTAVTFNPLYNDADPDGDPLTIVQVVEMTQPAHGTATIVNSGTAIQYTPGKYSSDTLLYEISDGNGHNAYAQISVTIGSAPPSTPPVAHNDTISVSGNSTVTFNPLANDGDLYLKPLTITSITSTPSHGTATIVNGGTQIQYTRTSAGVDSFTYQISNGTSTATATVTVNDPTPVNTPPNAIDDAITLGGIGNYVTFDPRTNDADFNADALTITGVSNAAHGTVQILNGGTQIKYTRTSAGSDSFTYTISDGHGGTDTATITVTDTQVVNVPPIATTDNIIVNGVGDAATLDPRVNDTDFNADSLTITAVSTPSHGTVQILGGTQIKYTRTSAGDDSFTYTISDGQGYTATATVDVTGSVSAATPGNRPPVVNGEALVVTSIGDSTTFDPLLNDTDPDNDALTITAVSTPLFGTATIVDNGTAITYTRTGAGQDSFTYTVSDGHGHTQIATVTVADFAGSSEQGPVATYDIVEVDGIGNWLTFDPRVNDSDANGDPLTITAVSTPELGTATIVNNGTAIKYQRSATGTDSFNYTISDAHGNTSTAVITVTNAIGANRAPTANADTAYMRYAGQYAYFDPRTNDFDPDGDPLTITSITQPGYGIAAINSDGTAIEYYNIGSTKYDSLEYTISDGQGHTATAELKFDFVNNPQNTAPFAHDDAISVPGAGTSYTFDPRTNDMDPNGDALTITSVTTPSHGAATIVNNGTAIKYTRTASGSDSFTYRISDGNGHTSTATVSVADPAPPANQAPTPLNDTITVNGVGDVATVNPRYNDTDFDGDGLTITGVSTASHGTVQIVNGNTRIKYTRTSAGNDSFTYTVSDGHGHTATATVSVVGQTYGAIPGPDQVLTTRYVYDSKSHLRFTVTPQGEVTEFDYNSAGQCTSTIVYRDHTYSLSGLGPDDTLTESQLTTWASGISDKSTVERTDTTYDFRGNVSTVKTYTAASTAGAGLTTQPYTTVTYVYDQFGNLLSRQTSGISNSEVFTYDGLGRVTSSVDLSNATTTVGYNDGSNITTVMLASGLVTTSTYNKAGELISTQQSASNLPTTTTAEKYDALGQLRMVTDPLGNTTYYLYDNVGRKVAAIAADGSMTEYRYDTGGRLVTTVAYANKLTSAQLASLVDGSGNPANVSLSSVRPASSSSDRWNWNIYDQANRLIETIDGGGYATIYTYDGASKLLSTSSYANAFSAGTISGFQTIAPTTLQLPTANPANDRAARNFYDDDGRLIGMLNADGDLSQIVYDAAGEKIESIAYATAVYSGLRANGTFAQLLANVGTSTADRHTRYFYDDSGKLAYTLDATLVPTQYVYDNSGNLTQMIQYAGSINSTSNYTLSYVASQVASDPVSEQTVSTYDAAGRVASVTNGYGSAEAATTSYTYDSAGNVTSVTDPNGNVTYNYYDQAGRLILTVDPDGYATATTYTLIGQIASVTHYVTQLSGPFNTSTPPTVTTNANDATTAFTYDQLGRVIQTTDANGYFEHYTLDAFGGRVSVTNKLGGVTTNSFDNRGFLVSETLPMTSYRSDGTVEANSVTNTFQYDAFGDRTQMVEAAGLTEQRTTNYAYDQLGHLTTTTHDQVQTVADDLKTTSNVTPTETVAYDAFGNVSETIDASGAKTFFYYDLLGRKTAEVNAVGTLSQFTYDTNGNVTSQEVYGDAVALPASPGGTAPSPVNPGNYRQTTYTYDHLNRLLTTTVANLQTGYYNTATSAYVVPATGNVTLTNYYDKDGNVVCQTDGDGNNVWFYYDKDNRKVAQVDQDLYLTTYALDANGNVTTETRYATKLASAPGVPPGSTVPTPTSDPTNDRTTVFTYDKNGQRLTETRQNVVAWTINSTNGALTRASTSATITYQYNGLGEVTSKTEATGDITTYVYDNTGRLTSTQGPSYTDYNDSQVQKISNDYYDGLNNLVRTVQKGDSGSNPDRVTTFAYGAGGRLSSTTDASGFTQNYAYDAAGRVKKTSYSRLESDGTSVTEAQAVRYDALGRAVFQSMAAWDGTQWNFGDETQVQYDTYGEVTARGVNGLWQQTYAYDNSGRLWRSNADDGTVHLYLYDANGKQTLDITSDGNALPTGYDWSTLTIAQAISLLTNNGANAIGAAAVSGMVVTISAYDARGQQTETVAPLRQLSGNATDGYVTANVVTSKTYNAFGEITAETDGNGNTTNYTYNTEGKVIETQHPSVSYTSENGAVSSARPTEYAYYDLSGRLVGTKDANNNVNTRTLLAGTGYDGADASVTKEFHADTGTVTNAYDVFGDMRKTTDGVGSVELFTYDGMDRLTVDQHPTRAANSPGNPTGSAITLTDYFAYDGLGQKIQHWNSQLGASVKQTTDYDSQGRVIQTAEMGGDTTTYSYAWDSSLTTKGLGTFGGWTKTTLNSAGLTETESNDYFGRSIGKVDFGSHNYFYTFNLAGQLSKYSNGPRLSAPSETYTYFNTGLMASENGGAANGLTSYAYDANGNRTKEQFAQNISGTMTTLHTASVSYDAMNRMLSYTDSGTENSSSTMIVPPATITWAYDLNGNIRHMSATYKPILDEASFGTQTTQSYWYKYDSMNRFVVTMGTFTGSPGSGTISRGSTGQTITYDLAGRRATSTDSSSATTTYLYSADGYLGQVKIGSVLRAKYAYDAMGRVTDYKEYATNGTQVVYENQSTYNTKSQLTQSVATSVDTNNNTTVNTTTYAYVLETAPNSRQFTTTYEGGALTDSYVTSTYNGTQQSETQDTSYTFTWWDTAKVNWTAYYVYFSPGNYSSSGDADLYDWQGNMKSAYVGGGDAHHVDYTLNAQNEILTRDDTQGGNTINYVHEVHYYFNGIALGDISNNGTSNFDYAQSIANHRTVQGTGDFQNGATTGTAGADFDQSYDAINGMNYQPTASSYTVQAGDTLQTIAYQLWGDSSFWYLIADANGLNSGSTLVAGQVLSIPNKVHNIHNSTSTYRVYDPNKAQGNLQPIPPKRDTGDSGGGCGVLGEIFLVIIAVVVSVVTAGAALAAIAPGVTSIGAGIGSVLGLSGAVSVGLGDAIVAGAIGGAVGSIVSQGVGLALGIQSKFSWSGVAEAAIGGGIGAGIADIPGISGGGLLGAVGRGLAGNVVTQGIEVATGLQKSFNWAETAAAGVAAGVGYEAGDALGIEPAADGTYSGPAPGSMDYAWRAGVSGMAGAIAGAGARSVISGTDFGDNIMAALPDAIGQTIGNMIVDGISQPSGYQIQPVPIDASQPITGGPSLQLQIPTLPDMSAYASADGIPAFDPAAYAAENAPVVVNDLPSISVASSEGAPLSPDAANSVETVVVIGTKPPQLTQHQLDQRFWAAVQNSRDKRQLPREVNYSFTSQYIVQQYRTKGTRQTPVDGTRIAFTTREATDNFLAQHQGVQPDGTSWAELLGETTGPNAVMIYAGAVDPSASDYLVSYPSENGLPAINVVLDMGKWQEVAINTLFHETYHATEYAAYLAGDKSADYANEYKARQYALMHMTAGGYP